MNSLLWSHVTHNCTFQAIVICWSYSELNTHTPNPQLKRSPSMNSWTGTGSSCRIPSSRQLSVMCVCALSMHATDTGRWESVTPLTAGFLQLLGRKPAPAPDKRKREGKHRRKTERESERERESREYTEMLARPGEPVVQRWRSWNNREPMSNNKNNNSMVSQACGLEAALSWFSVCTCEC